jgi:hypothetical protein
VRRTYKVRRNDEGEAQSREARDRWTFYEAIKIDEPKHLQTRQVHLNL